MPIQLDWRGATQLTVFGQSIRADAFTGRSIAEIAQSHVQIGADECALGDLFRITGDSSDAEIELEGDLRNVRELGRGMTSGRLIVHGDVGAYLGAELSGGQIEVFGSADVGAGVAMRRGLIRIRNGCGDHVGGPWPGQEVGMRGGMLLVDGDLGAFAGEAMRRGLIAARGAAGDALGRNMIAGTILALGEIGNDPGIGMKRGTILALGGHLKDPNPSGFRSTGTVSAHWFALYARALNDVGFATPAPPGRFLRYNGDTLANGLGELLVRIRS
jgi:formylmethanofuran dehydrogenase subunit C